MKQKEYRFSTHYPLDIIKQVFSHHHTPRFKIGINATIDEHNKIQIIYRTGTRNSWNPIFYGSIIPDSEASIITGSFQTAPSVIAILWICRAFAALILHKLLMVHVYNAFRSFNLLNILFPILMLIYSFVLEHFCKKFAEPNKQKILDFLATELSAQYLPTQQL